MNLLKISIVFFLFITCKTFGADSVPIVENGVLDISHWDFSKDGIIKISDGSVTGLNPTYYDKENDSAEFYIKVILPKGYNTTNQPDIIALSIPPLLSPYYFWINDNIELSNGYNYVARWKVNYYDKSNILPVPGKLDHLNLYLKIFNYSNIKLIREPILIGKENDIREHRWGVLFREGIIDGALFLLFIINILLLFGNRKNHGFFILALFAFFQALNLIGKGETLNFLSDISADTLIKIQITFNYIKLFLIYSLFINLFFNKHIKTAFKIISACFILVIILLIFPVNWVFLNYILMFYYLLLFIGLSCFILVSVSSIKKDRRKSISVLLSTSILLLSYLFYIIQNKIYIFSLTVIFVGQQDNLAYGILSFVIINTYYLYISLSGEKIENAGPEIDLFATNYKLSKRERDILVFLVQRYSYKEIAKVLFISNKTVETHIYHIYQKTGSKNKTELIDMVQLEQ